MKYNYDLITAWFEKRGFDIQYYHDQKIIISDWNKVPKEMEKYLSQGHDLYYEDDGYYCDHCYKFVHRDDDQVQLEYGLLCRDCSKENPQWVYDEFIFHATEDPYRYRALPEWLPVPKDFDLFYCGMENGLYDGMNDTPEKAVKNVIEQMGSEWYGVFKVDSSNPFMVEFSIYVKKEEAE